MSEWWAVGTAEHALCSGPCLYLFLPRPTVACSCSVLHRTAAPRHRGTQSVHLIDQVATLTAIATLRRYMALENTEVLRQHISTSTYMSGTSEVGYKERRGYYRRRSSSK